MSFLSFRGPIFHWTMIMGERVVWYSGVACTNSGWRVLGSTLCATSTITSVYFCYLYVNRVSCIRYDISLMLTNQLGIWNNMPENAVNFRKANKEPPWSHRKHRILPLQSTFRKHYKIRMCVVISVHICRRSLNPGVQSLQVLLAKDLGLMMKHLHCNVPPSDCHLHRWKTERLKRKRIYSTRSCRKQHILNYTHHHI